MGNHPATASPLVHRYTLEEFFALEPPPGGGHYELIAGVLYMVPPPGVTHSVVVSRLNLTLAAYASAHPDRCVLFVPRAAVWTPADTYLEPDLFLVTPDRVTAHPDGLPSADLVLEVLSASTAVYDRTAKADTYAALGVRELWLVELDHRRIEQRVLDGTRWRITGVYGGGAAIESVVFRGLRIVPDEVFG